MHNALNGLHGPSALCPSLRRFQGQRLSRLRKQYFRAAARLAVVEDRIYPRAEDIEHSSCIAVAMNGRPLNVLMSVLIRSNARPSRARPVSLKLTGPTRRRLCIPIHRPGRGFGGCGELSWDNKRNSALNRRQGLLA
jgi:hypothetical protein